VADAETLKVEGGRRCISAVAIYRKCTQRIIMSYTEEGRLAAATYAPPLPLLNPPLILTCY